MSLILRVLLATFILALATGSPQYRLLDQKLTCLRPAECPADETLKSGSLKFFYGQKDEQLGGTLDVIYLDTGDVTFHAQAVDTVNYPSRYSTVVLGNGPLTGNQQCEQIGVAGNSVQINNVKFDECGFSQRFEGQIVHRRIVVRVRHHFTVPGQVVDFIGYRDVQVDLYLEPNQPSPQIIKWVREVGNPPISLDVCGPLTHKITALPSETHDTWKFKVEPDNYVPQDIGYGFKLEKCVLKPYVIDSAGAVVLGNPVDWSIFLQNGQISYSALDRVRRNYVKIPGQSYEIIIAQTRSASLSVRADRPPRIECDVCLCSLDPVTGDCPVGINIDYSRSAFEKLPANLVLPNSLLHSGPVKTVPRQDFKKYTV